MITFFFIIILLWGINLSSYLSIYSSTFQDAGETERVEDLIYSVKFEDILGKIFQVKSQN